MTNSDSNAKQEALIFIQGKQSLAQNENDIYPLQLIANVSTPTTSNSANSQLKKLSKNSLQDSSYEIINTEMATSEYSIILDDEEETVDIPQNTKTPTAKSRKLPCPKCSFQTTDKITLERHMRKHNSIFVCKTCKIHFPSVSSLIDHYSKRHFAEAVGNDTEAQHSCPMCPFSSIEKLEYDKHITRHETAAYLCKICGQPFAKQVSMKWHEKFKHNISTDDDKPMEDSSENTENLINVKVAQVELISMDELLNNVIDGEQDIKPFARRFNCMFCSKSFSTKLVLRYHALRNHRERLIIGQMQKTDLSQVIGTKKWNPPKRKPLNQSTSYHHQCPACTFSTIYKSTFDRHLKKHGEAKFDCNLCGMPFTIKGNLNRHKKVNHPDVMASATDLPKRHKCSLCIYNTSYKSTLERHLRTHGIAKYHCNLCAMPFVFTGSFVTHRELKHDIRSKDFGETVFTDKVSDDTKLSCNGKFMNRRKCPYCGIYMSSASKLNRHLRTHKNAGYYCGNCSIFFQQRSDFENHMSNHLQSIIVQSREPQAMAEVPSVNSNVEFETSAQVGNGQDLVTDELATFHNVIRGESNVNELSNHMVQVYDNQTANKPNGMVKIDLTEQQLSKASLISRHAMGQAPVTETNRRFGEPADSSLKIVSTCGSADKHILGSSTGQGSIQNLYNGEQTYPITSQANTFQLQNSSLFSSQRTDTATLVYAANEQNFERSPNESYARDNQNQQQQLLLATPSDRNLLREPSNSLNRDGGDLCACKIVQPENGEVLANVPLKGRYAKLVSDFDDFALRPFACSLCFFRCSVLKDLYSHVQNHLTGCNITPTPATAKFNTGAYLQGLAQQGQGDATNRSQSNNPAIEYID